MNSQALTLVELATESTWQTLLASAIRDGGTLLAALQLSPDSCALSETAARQFPVRVPEPFLQRMRKGDPDDPLLRQVLAVPAEELLVPGWEADPLQEANANPVPGLIHKYHGRVLLLPTSGCAINCRYCFRRHFAYSDNRLDRQALKDAIRYIETDRSISEVILSGGDPLLLPDTALQRLIGMLADIPHLQRLRIHTRLPVVIPSRVTDGLIEMLKASRLEPVVVIHCNHPNEIDESLGFALKTFRDNGIPILNQAVLLRGINDRAEELAALQERLFSAGVLPYYLHLPDKVAGTQHFEVDEHTAAELIATLRAMLPGYLVPQLAREVPGETSKQIL